MKYFYNKVSEKSFLKSVVFRDFYSYEFFETDFLKLFHGICIVMILTHGHLDSVVVVR